MRLRQVTVYDLPTALGAVGTVSAVLVVVIVTPAALVVVSAVIVILAFVATVSWAFPRSANVNDRFVLQKVVPSGTQGVLSHPGRGHGLSNTGDACAQTPGIALVVDRK